MYHVQFMYHHNKLFRIFYNSKLLYIDLSRNIMCIIHTNRGMLAVSEQIMPRNNHKIVQPELISGSNRSDSIVSLDITRRKELKVSQFHINTEYIYIRCSTINQIRISLIDNGNTTMNVWYIYHNHNMRVNMTNSFIHHFINIPFAVANFDKKKLFFILNNFLKSFVSHFFKSTNYAYWYELHVKT